MDVDILALDNPFPLPPLRGRAGGGRTNHDNTGGGECPREPFLLAVPDLRRLLAFGRIAE